jgi:hypothetical protein
MLRGIGCWGLLGGVFFDLFFFIHFLRLGMWIWDGGCLGGISRRV